MGRPAAEPPTTVALARYLGISPSTVSIVLRGEAQRRKISARTVQRVREAARKFNYVPNQWARNFRRQRSGMIGVILASFRWDWAQDLHRGMLEVLEPHGYTSFMAIHLFNAERARREVFACLQRRDEAVIVAPMPGLEEVCMQARDMGIPLIFIGDRPPTIPEAHFVAWDSPADARLAVEHLVQIGRKRIGYVGFDYPMPLNQARYEAYRSVLQQAGLPTEQRWVTLLSMALPPDEIARQSVAALFESDKPSPDALFVQHDGLAVLLLDALRSRGIRVPEQVALIGMGDYPITRYSGISLSTVKEPIEEIGREAARAAVDLLARGAKAPIQRLLPCGRLMARHTTQVTK